jgi:hypothetical protein
VRDYTRQEDKLVQTAHARNVLGCTAPVSIELFDEVFGRHMIFALRRHDVKPQFDKPALKTLSAKIEAYCFAKSCMFEDIAAFIDAMYETHPDPLDVLLDPQGQHNGSAYLSLEEAHDVFVDMLQDMKPLPQIELEAEDEVLVRKFYSNGETFFVYRLSSGRAVRLDGHRMNTFFQDYRNKSVNRKFELYSLRDELNRPRVTFRVNLQNGGIDLCLGVSEKLPTFRYTTVLRQYDPDIIPFFDFHDTTRMNMKLDNPLYRL